MRTALKRQKKIKNKTKNYSSASHLLSDQAIELNLFHYVLQKKKGKKVLPKNTVNHDFQYIRTTILDESNSEILY